MMNQKTVIFEKTLKSVISIMDVDVSEESNSFLKSYEFKYLNLNIVMQTDFGTHVETIIEFNKRLYSNGGDYISTIKQWESWADETINLFSSVSNRDQIVLEEWLSKTGDTIGGLIKLTDKMGKTVIFSDIANNLFPLFKKKRRSKVELK